MRWREGSGDGGVPVSHSKTTRRHPREPVSPDLSATDCRSYRPRRAHPALRRSAADRANRDTRVHALGWRGSGGRPRGRSRGRAPSATTSRGRCGPAYGGRCAARTPGRAGTATDMWRTFIHRSARHRMNSMSSAERCALRVTAVVPSYSSTRELVMSPFSTKSRVMGVPGYGVGCWMYGQSTCLRANARLAATPSRVSSGLPTIRPPTTSRPLRCSTSTACGRRVADAAAVLAQAVLGARLQERQVVLEDVLDAEKDIPEAGLLHQRPERLAMRGDRRGHALDDVVDVVEAAVDDRPAEGLEAGDVERDVVVDEEDGAGAARARVGNVVEHPRNREAMEIPAAHLDDRAETAVERAAPRRLDDVDAAAHHRVAGENAGSALWRPDLLVARAARRRAPDCTASPAPRGTTRPRPLTAACRARSRGPVRGTSGRLRRGRSRRHRCPGASTPRAPGWGRIRQPRHGRPA